MEGRHVDVRDGRGNAEGGRDRGREREVTKAMLGQDETRGWSTSAIAEQKKMHFVLDSWDMVCANETASS